MGQPLDRVRRTGANLQPDCLAPTFRRVQTSEFRIESKVHPAVAEKARLEMRTHGADPDHLVLNPVESLAGAPKEDMLNRILSLGFAKLSPGIFQSATPAGKPANVQSFSINDEWQEIWFSTSGDDGKLAQSTHFTPEGLVLGSQYRAARAVAGNRSGAQVDARVHVEFLKFVSQAHPELRMSMLARLNHFKEDNSSLEDRLLERGFRRRGNNWELSPKGLPAIQRVRIAEDSSGGSEIAAIESYLPTLDGSFTQTLRSWWDQAGSERRKNISNEIDLDRKSIPIREGEVRIRLTSKKPGV